MKALVCLNPGMLEYKEVAPSVPRPGHSLIQIKRVGICGTDIHAYDGTQTYFSYPRILGHELSGDVIETGGAGDFTPGERVTIIPYFNCGQCIACRNHF